MRSHPRSIVVRKVWLALLLLAVAVVQPTSCFPAKRYRPTACVGTRGNLSCRHTAVTRVRADSPRWRYTDSGFKLSAQQWDGDDIRWMKKIRRRFRRTRGGDPTPVRTTLILLNLGMYLYQTVSAVSYIRKVHPSYWPSRAVSIVGDTLMGSSLLGPATYAFVYSNALARSQPHRYLTSGFLHGSLLHLVANLDALRRLPLWLETGLGVPLFLTAYLAAIVAGNLGHAIVTANPMDRSLCLGASGGICGLYGLMYAMLVKMGNQRAAFRVAKGMGILFLYGLLIESVSNASHIGGFLGGAVVGALCGPNFVKSYSMRRKWSLDVDSAPRDYRQVIGFGRKATNRGLLPISFVWLVACALLSLQPKYRAMPMQVLKGLLNPSTLLR